MTYDALNRVITTEDPFGLTLTYTYDADGNRTEIQDSLGGVTTYVYDADNELISEQFGGTGQTPLRIDMTYDADGEISTETRYSDLAGTQVVVTSSYTYDADGEITEPDGRQRRRHHRGRLRLHLRRRRPRDHRGQPRA